MQLKPNCRNASNEFNDHFLETGGDDANSISNDDHLKYLHNSPKFSMHLPPAAQN